MISSVNPNSLPLQAGSQFRDLDLRARAAAAVAAAHAAAVDRNSAFPAAAFAEIRKQRLLGIMVPRSLGGEGASISDIVDVCYVLGQACASTGMIYAMHQVRWPASCAISMEMRRSRRILRRIAADQLLLASSTTEGLAGGNIRESEAPIEMRTASKSGWCARLPAFPMATMPTASSPPRAARDDSAPSDQVLARVLEILL